ncbi:acyl carrier protein [Nocardia sp. CA-135398]|uniref:acyl carrier protein n=1 Tax=Nocardia sp. CA-135398 TaxID=3239977 RepID=UPI003D9868E3
MAVPEHRHDKSDRNTLRLRAIAADVLEVDEDGIDIRAHFYDDLCATSLEKAEILARIEREFGVALADGSVEAVDSLGDVLAVVDGGVRK